jgi:hypothetical protein
MKNILLFNDFSPEAEHATELALLLAGKTNANLYVWDIHDNKEVPVVAEMATITINEELLDIPVGKNSWIDKLESKLNWQTGLRPAVHFIEDIDYAPDHILPITQRFDIGLLIKGIAGDEEDMLQVETSILSCSTKSGCPVMLVPEKFPYKTFEKIVYPTDLRFCRREVISFLCKYAKALNSGILVANVPAQGLPHMESNYALTVFKDEIMHSLNYENIYFSNVRERDIPKALDVLVNGMNNDLLVLVNHKYHFNELLGREEPYTIPANIRVPLLVFPS